MADESHVTLKSLNCFTDLFQGSNLPWSYGQFHGVGRTFRTLILCLVPQLGMRIILSCCYFIHTSSLYHVGHLNILCHSHISAMSQYKGGVGRTQTN